MSKRGAGVGFLAIGAFLYVARNADALRLDYGTYSTIPILFFISLTLGVSYLVRAELEERKK